ncbi:MAG TPA: hypothetical protein VJB82_04825 [Candidatus Peribacterales bacterium]|nr:hypothetical protein [Candidatus Peribacterales bacterium]
MLDHIQSFLDRHAATPWDVETTPVELDGMEMWGLDVYDKREKGDTTVDDDTFVIARQIGFVVDGYRRRRTGEEGERLRAKDEVACKLQIGSLVRVEGVSSILPFRSAVGEVVALARPGDCYPGPSVRITDKGSIEGVTTGPLFRSEWDSLAPLENVDPS